MEQHALDLLQLAIWVIGTLGALIVVLLGVIAALAKWGGVELFARLSDQDAKMVAFQRTVSVMGDEIKALLTSETRLLREAQHQLSERVGRLEVFRDLVQADNRFGRRWEDQNHNGSD